ncbi:Gfo/Idh/MocA family oxidoreductase [Nibrella saemangeumensis]|uniref:Gfo/Idh/MocA family oxidoreductase n=1 Tax=Nibrella saemangeumensis TaxID=1084526 RepID=A0ABP8NPA4_9BACT
MSNQRRGLLIGAGYFSQFHIEAWQRIPEITITGVCDQNAGAADAFARQWNLPNAYEDIQEALEAGQPDFVDIITPPATHKALVEEAARRGIAIICQKPLAPTQEEARALVAIAEQQGVPFMVHENFRFQPWHRELKKLLDSGIVGSRIFSLYWRLRMGDGWQADAYLARQPYFRDYQRLLIYETGIHLIDTLRYLTGSEVTDVFARLHQRNPDIQGEDSGLVVLSFRGGADAVLDMSRYNENRHETPRYTFAELLTIDAEGGTLRLFADGSIEVQPLGKPAYPHAYTHRNHGFAGDCVFFCQRHFVDAWLANTPFETSGADYLKNITIQEAIYHQTPPYRM